VVLRSWRLRSWGLSLKDVEKYLEKTFDKIEGKERIFEVRKLRWNILGI
jgi:hypothetical protein